MTRIADEELAPLLLTLAREVGHEYFDPTCLHQREDLQQIALLAGWEAVLRGRDDPDALRQSMRTAVRNATMRRIREAAHLDMTKPAEPVHRDQEPQGNALGRAMRRLPDLEYQLIAGICMGLAPMTVGLRLKLSMRMTARLLVLGRRRLADLMEAEERGRAA